MVASHRHTLHLDLNLLHPFWHLLVLFIPTAMHHILITVSLMLHTILQLLLTRRLPPALELHTIQLRLELCTIQARLTQQR